MALTREDILRGLRDLGVAEGGIVMAHVALSAFGEVEGGADTVIAALADAVGSSGTLCMPAMSGARPFDVQTSPSMVGAVTERFRTWPGVVRSIHPTHSVCCLGPRAEELQAGHIQQPTALGPQSPWGRLARDPKGCILLLGCDQDRNTLLHCAEEAVDAPYLNTIKREYIDERGVTHTKTLDKYPGPHRDFIGMDRLFREAGAMGMGTIGQAVCRLMRAGESLQVAIDALRKDPAAVLCENPDCMDCVRQRADIARRRLASEAFTASAVIDEIGLPPDEIPAAVDALQNQGIDAVEFGPDSTAAMLALSLDELAAVAANVLARGARVSLVSCPEGADLSETLSRTAEIARALAAPMVKLPPLRLGAPLDFSELRSLVAELAHDGLTVVVENAPKTVADTGENCDRLLWEAPDIGLAFNPAAFAQVGERPFLGTYRGGKLKRSLRQVYITDGCRPGGEPHTLPGRGHGEVKELMSALRCRSFDGVFCLKMGDRRGTEEFARQVRAFWRLMETM